jgi:arginine decarboxylase
MGLKLGLKVFIVIEKPSELEIIIEESTKLGITPLLGVRIRLSSISAGKWQNSGGEKSKFGLHATELLKLIERLRQAQLLNSLKLMHFHMGSQVANIHDIKNALTEATQFFSELRRLGAPITTVNAGGGLGIDYEGTRSRHECSVNYSLAEYAHNIIRSFVDICTKKQLPHPDIITESGRAITAHHAVLVTNVIDFETHQHKTSVIKQAIKTPIVEAWHDSQFSVDESRMRFVQGDLNLEQLAKHEQLHLEQCLMIAGNLDPDIRNHQEIKYELDIKLADKVFCNLSIFQSMPDIWGINQIFPIMPIHRLNEQPTRRAIIQDLTCDSDGRIDYYIDNQNIENTLPLHPLETSQPYLIGFFLLGAYQEILGDMHNLFGDTHSINVELTEQGYRFSNYLEGEHITDVLDYVHIDTEKLKTAYLLKLAESDLTETEKIHYQQELFAGLTAYTYLEK